MGEAIRDAMIAIEDSVTDQKGQKLLEGALPKNYLGLEQDLLAELLKIFNRSALQTTTGDVFGRIYEYFLNQFAQSGAQEGGEFFTASSRVRMIVNVIEPDHGVVLDPACGLAGTSTTSSAHGTTCSISSRNSQRRVRLPVIPRPRLCCFMRPIVSVVHAPAKNMRSRFVETVLHGDGWSGLGSIGLQGA